MKMKTQKTYQNKKSAAWLKATKIAKTSYGHILMTKDGAQVLSCNNYCGSVDMALHYEDGAKIVLTGLSKRSINKLIDLENEVEQLNLK